MSCFPKCVHGALISPKNHQKYDRKHHEKWLVLEIGSLTASWQMKHFPDTTKTSMEKTLYLQPKPFIAQKKSVVYFNTVSE